MFANLLQLAVILLKISSRKLGGGDKMPPRASKAGNIGNSSAIPAAATGQQASSNSNRPGMEGREPKVIAWNASNNYL